MARSGQLASMDNLVAYDDRHLPRLRIHVGVLLAVWTVPAFLSIVQRWASSALTDHPASFWALAATEGPGWYLWAAMTPGVFAVAQRFPLRRPVRARALAAHTAAWVMSLLVHALVTSLVVRATDLSASRLPLARFVGLSAVSWLPSTTLLYGATVGVAFWMRAIQREQVRAREGARLGVQLARAELEALRSQLHPHFIFNTLNTIAILIRERDTDVSARMVTQLGDVLRHVLRGSRTDETTLGEERDMVSSYLEIEQVRFDERLQVRWSIPDTVLCAAVPSLLLQPLIENALRHGIAHHIAGGTVEIGARRDDRVLHIWVRDSGTGTLAAAPRAGSANTAGGMGLANTRERLARLYPDESSLTLSASPGGGTRVDVHLPWRVPG